jgi:DEAD/DEAH box helicase domain-containing protein
MVAFRQAAARVDHHESLVGDDADERERHTYQIGRHFEMRPEYSDGAFVLPSLPFGLEHLDQVTLREVNFGPDPVMGARVTIADEERPLQGFHVCQGCGLVVAGPTDGDAPLRPGHRRTCPHQSGSGQWRDIYLYRQMTSEALRILLPVSTVLIAEKLATFEACLDLGLRRKFGGNPYHLQIVQHQEPAADGTKRRYLVIFDTVPGGTSFLRDLARPEEFRQVLQLALDALTSCRCRSDPQKPACYRCLYSHRSQRDLALISRELGIEIKLENQEWKVYLDNMQHEFYQICRAGLIMEPYDPSQFLRVFTTDSGFNRTGWSDPDYDRLYQELMRTADQAKRLELMQEMEKILTDAMPILPIYYYTNQYLMTPGVRGWVDNLMSLGPYEQVWLE